MASTAPLVHAAPATQDISACQAPSHQWAAENCSPTLQIDPHPNPWSLWMLPYVAKKPQGM